MHQLVSMPSKSAKLCILSNLLDPRQLNPNSSRNTLVQAVPCVTSNHVRCHEQPSIVPQLCELAFSCLGSAQQAPQHKSCPPDLLLPIAPAGPSATPAPQQPSAAATAAPPSIPAASAPAPAPVPSQPQHQIPNADLMAQWQAGLAAMFAAAPQAAQQAPQAQHPVPQAWGAAPAAAAAAAPSAAAPAAPARAVAQPVSIASFGPPAWAVGLPVWWAAAEGSPQLATSVSLSAAELAEVLKVLSTALTFTVITETFLICGNTMFLRVAGATTGWVLGNATRHVGALPSPP